MLWREMTMLSVCYRQPTVLIKTSDLPIFCNETLGTEQVNNYGPFAILPILSTALEKIVTDKWTKFPEKIQMKSLLLLNVVHFPPSIINYCSNVRPIKLKKNTLGNIITYDDITLRINKLKQLKFRYKRNYDTRKLIHKIIQAH